MPTETATLAGGCFWCLEAVYEMVRGVEKSVSGYAGGTVESPSYRQVCTGTTGHAEVVRLTFDPEVVSYRELVELFFVIHDPTTVDRQGHDVGPQYRSAIFYESEEQRETAEDVMAEVAASGAWPSPIVTEVTPLTTYYEAEEYHQQYFRRNPSQPYCQFIIAPKVAKARKELFAALKA